MIRIDAETSVAFRSAKERNFRGAKGDNATVIDSPTLSKQGKVRSNRNPKRTRGPKLGASFAAFDYVTKYELLLTRIAFHDDIERSAKGPRFVASHRSQRTTIMVSAGVTNGENRSNSRTKEHIRDEMRERVAKFEHANLHDLTYRLVELDQEWDVERILEFAAGSVMLGGVVLSRLSNRKWLLFPCVAAGFLVQQVVAGWCPPYLVLRQLGFRTAAEINRERMALKIIRGDFAQLGLPPVQGGSASQDALLDAVEEK
jgi:hypothetical protein